MYVDVMYVLINLHIIWNIWLQILQSVLLSCPCCWPVVVTTETSSRPLSRVHCSQCGCRHLSLHITLSPPLLRARSVEMRVSRVSAVLLLSLAALTSAQGEAGEGRPKPWLREKMERQKVVTIIIIMCSVSPRVIVQDLFWFRTTEDEAGQAACSAVDEASVEIVPGPPGDTCQVQYSTYSTVQYNCNLSPFLTSGGRS